MAFAIRSATTFLWRSSRYVQKTCKSEACPASAAGARSSYVSVLAGKFEIESTAEVCNATKERQDAVKAFAGDALLVLGSANSSNTRRLSEVARCKTFRAGTLDEVRALDLSGIRHLGVTSGASTPESFFEEALSVLS